MSVRKKTYLEDYLKFRDSTETSESNQGFGMFVDGGAAQRLRSCAAKFAVVVVASQEEGCAAMFCLVLKTVNSHHGCACSVLNNWELFPSRELAQCPF
ncbi:hypothetical protein V2J09_004337 [Rumex salicifolius]